MSRTDKFCMGYFGVLSWQNLCCYFRASVIISGNAVIKWQVFCSYGMLVRHIWKYELQKKHEEKLRVLLHKTPSETLQVLADMYANQQWSADLKWHKRFCCGHASVMICIFGSLMMSTVDLIHYEFVPEGNIVNKEMYTKILCFLK